MPKVSTEVKNLPAVVKSLKGVFKEINDNIAEEISNHIADELRSGKSDWPVLTGESQAAFEGTKEGVGNTTDYAGKVEERTEAVDRYTKDNIKRIGETAINKVIKNANN